MTLPRRESSGKIGVLTMAIGLGMLLGSLLGGCGDGSSVAGSGSAGPLDVPLVDQKQPEEFQTASFALG
jgi:hypothetical protein